MSRDATTALLRALAGAFGDLPGYAVEAISSRAWSSATFTGARHVVQVRLAGDGAVAAADAVAANLSEREFTLRGHVLADIALVSREATAGIERLRIEALTVEDC